ncbi:hypothetical protein UY3_00336 [Chelonia mydas]|uniref:Uncharacterized protein n=1 Tax=Chelonia mydas TaxID=8469 RepID=M7BYW1_CHEMY|nr:hypothetical protein UY3_00336 [Chelonia mydas]
MHDRKTWDTLQCKVKVKDMWNAYYKAWGANHHSGAVPTSCRFYKELDPILGGNPTSIAKAPVDTSVAHVPVKSGLSQEEEILDEDVEGEGDPEAEDNSEVRDACSQELFSTPEEASQSQLSELGEAQERRLPAAQTSSPAPPQTLPTHSYQPPGSSLYPLHSTPAPSQSSPADSQYPLHSTPIPRQFSPGEAQYPLHCTAKEKVGYDTWT